MIVWVMPADLRCREFSWLHMFGVWELDLVHGLLTFLGFYVCLS